MGPAGPAGPAAPVHSRRRPRDPAVSGPVVGRIGRQSALRRAFGRLWLGRGGDGVAARLRRPRGVRADHTAVQGAGLIKQPLAPA